MERIDTGGGFSVLDGAALVMGSAIASIHTLRVMRSDLTGAGWIMIWLTFAWVGVTAAGPFLFLARRFGRRLPDYPKIGDRLWALLGLPWLVTAVLQSGAPGSEPRQNSLFTMTLSVGLALTCLIALERDLEHLGYGSPGPGRSRRGGPMDQPRRSDPGHCLANPMWVGDGCAELTPSPGRKTGASALPAAHRGES